mmetsp:Transcript_19248/g.76632  ORF Transcript_19248/g.76632 Transcript_19248/m.76632 type:complete len:230 (-) Transcript_19248:840-1529(-)
MADGRWSVQIPRRAFIGIIGRGGDTSVRQALASQVPRPEDVMKGAPEESSSGEGVGYHATKKSCKASSDDGQAAWSQASDREAVAVSAFEGLVAATVTRTSAQLDQTCEVSSQSQRQPKTAGPGGTSAGTTTRSRMIPSVKSPLQAPCPERSVPFVGSATQPSSCGHGGSNWRHCGPSAPPVAGSGQQPCAPAGWPEEVESKLIRGIGFIAHVDPGGCVPSSTKVPPTT